MRIEPRMLLAALLVCAAPAAAGEWPLSTVMSYGPAPVVGIGAGRFDAGRTLDLELSWHPEQRTNWILRAAHTELSRTSSLLDETSSAAFFNGGVLYVPDSPAGDIDLRADLLQIGVRHSEALGFVRSFVSAAAGASLVRDERSNLEALISNDRRVAWDARPAVAGLSTVLAPSFSLGMGLETTLPGRLALASGISADFTAVRGLVGAVVPVRVGARWPSAPLPELRPGSARAPQLRASAGWSALNAPSPLKGSLGDGHSVAAEIELPIGERWGLSLVGEHASREYREALYRQELDNFGNVVTVAAGSSEASLAATTITAGVRAHQQSGPVIFSIRAGAGWGRTSGFGTSLRTPDGAYLDASGNWIPSWTLIDVGLGHAATGWAYSASAGAEAPLLGALRAFAEGGVTSIELGDRSIHTTPLRFGLALK